MFNIRYHQKTCGSKRYNIRAVPFKHMRYQGKALLNRWYGWLYVSFTHTSKEHTLALNCCYGWFPHFKSAFPGYLMFKWNSPYVWIYIEINIQTRQIEDEIKFKWLLEINFDTVFSKHYIHPTVAFKLVLYVINFSTMTIFLCSVNQIPSFSQQNCW